MKIKEKRNSFEELQVGKVFETEEKVFPEKNLILGILWEGDLQIHSDREVMAEHPFGDRIVHGSSVTTMALGLLFEMDPIRNTKMKLKQMSCSYVKPVYVEDAIKARFQIISKQVVSDSTVDIAFNFNVFRKDKDLACKGDVVISMTLNG